jgi:hypothetical protein
VASSPARDSLSKDFVAEVDMSTSEILARREAMFTSVTENGPQIIQEITARRGFPNLQLELFDPVDIPDAVIAILKAAARARVRHPSLDSMKLLELLVNAIRPPSSTTAAQAQFQTGWVLRDPATPLEHNAAPVRIDDASEEALRALASVLFVRGMAWFNAALFQPLDITDAVTALLAAASEKRERQAHLKDAEYLESVILAMDLAQLFAAPTAPLMRSRVRLNLIGAAPPMQPSTRTSSSGWTDAVAESSGTSKAKWRARVVEETGGRGV